MTTDDVRTAAESISPAKRRATVPDDVFEDTRDYGDDDRFRRDDDSFPEPEGADRW